MLGVTATSSEKEVTVKLEAFTRKFNVQINIYESGKQNPAKFSKNRFTDCLVLTLFKSTSTGTPEYYSMYHKNYQELSTANYNISSEFDSSKQKLSKDFIPVSGITLALSHLSQFQIPSDMISSLSSKLNTLQNSNVAWPFLPLFERFCNAKACMRCNKLKSSTNFSCGCSLCHICTSLSNTTHQCSHCNTFLKPLDMNLIKS
jgi:hypothetical protein